MRIACAQFVELRPHMCTHRRVGNFIASNAVVAHAHCFVEHKPARVGATVYVAWLRCRYRRAHPL